MSAGNDREFIDYLQRKAVKLRDRLNWLYFGAMPFAMAGVILVITAAQCSHPLAIGLTASAGACFVAAGILLTIRRLTQG